MLFSNCARSLEYSSSSTLEGLSYHICGKLEGAFIGSPSSQHQHCTDEAQKAETVLSAVSFFVSRRVDTAECNAEPPHLTRTTLINGPQEGCYMHVKITRAMNPASLTNNITAQTVDYTDGHGQGQRKGARKRTEDEKKRANVTKIEELNVNEKMVINERSNDVTGTPLTDEKATATRRTKTFEKDR